MGALQEELAASAEGLLQPPPPAFDRYPSRAAQAIKSSVFYGGSALLSGVNAITPHLAGAVDIMVVEQPDKTYKSSPFYVRFGKYTHLRNKDRIVQVFVNDEPVPFSMQLGDYGQAYFTTESSDATGSGIEEESILAGLMSAPDGYDSGDEECASDMLPTSKQPTVPRGLPHAASSSALDTTAAAAEASASAPGGVGLGRASMPCRANTSHLSSGRRRSSSSSSSGGGGSGGSGSNMVGTSPKSGAYSPGRLESPPAEDLDISGPAQTASCLSPATRDADETSSGLHTGLEEQHDFKHRQQQQQQRQQTLVGPQSCPSLPLGAQRGSLHHSLEASFGTCDQQWGGQQQQEQQQQQQQQQPIFGFPDNLGDKALHSGTHSSTARLPQPAATPVPCSSSIHTSSPCTSLLSSSLHRLSKSHHAGQLPPSRLSPSPHSSAPDSEAPRPSTPHHPQAPCQPLAEIQAANPSESQLQHQHHALQQQQQRQLHSQQHQQLQEQQEQQQDELHEREQQQQQLHCQQHQQQQDLQEQQQDEQLEREVAALEDELHDDSIMMSASSLSATGLRASLELVLQHEDSQQQHHTSQHPLQQQYQHQRYQHQQHQQQYQQLQRYHHHQHEQMQPSKGQQQGLGAPDAQADSLALQQETHPDHEHAAHQPTCNGVIPNEHTQSHPLPQSQPQPSPHPAPTNHLPPASHAPVAEPTNPSTHAISSAPASHSPALEPTTPSKQAMGASEDEYEPQSSSAHYKSPAKTPLQPSPLPAHAPISIASPNSYSGSPFAPAALDSDEDEEMEDAEAVARSAPALQGPMQRPPSAPLRWQTQPCLGRMGSSSVPQEGFMGSGAIESRQQQQQQQQPQAAGVERRRRKHGSLPCEHHELGAVSDQQGETVQVVELSACGELLQPGMSYAMARQIFEAHLISPDVWKEKGAQLMASPVLVVRVGEVLYPWASAAPLAVGLLLFKQHWPHLVPAGTPCWAPPSLQLGSRRHSRTPPGLPEVRGVDRDGPAIDKKAAAAVLSSWRIWPFGCWRSDRSSAVSKAAPASPQQQQQQQPPPQPQQQAASKDSAGASIWTKAAEGAAAAAPPSMPASPRRSQASPAASVHVHTRKSLLPTAEQLCQLRLREGQNTIRFKAGASELVAYIYFYRWCTKLVISDIDGTITRSDVLGHLLPAMGWDWSHPGITRLFTDIASNNYQMMYLSSRSVGQANITRDYINTLVQGRHRMPVGPVIISPHGLLPSLYREMILRRPHEFKIATLQEIRALFPPEWNPFYAGFGNRDTDEISYRAVSVPPARIFIINPKGELRKATLAIQSSTWNTLAAINDLVHDIFPPISKLQPLTAIPAPPRPPLLFASPPKSTQQAATKELPGAPAAPLSDSGSNAMAVDSEAGARAAGGEGMLSAEGRKQTQRRPSSSMCSSTTASIAGEVTVEANESSFASLLPPRALKPREEDVLPVSSDEYSDLGYWSTGFSFINPAALLAPGNS